MGELLQFEFTPVQTFLLFMFMALPFLVIFGVLLWQWWRGDELVKKIGTGTLTTCEKVELGIGLVFWFVMVVVLWLLTAPVG